MVVGVIATNLLQRVRRVVRIVSAENETPSRDRHAMISKNLLQAAATVIEATIATTRGHR